jgi:phosphopantothenoylcysteine decarboxylase / phosphopantothenate---cysteine ligase
MPQKIVLGVTGGIAAYKSAELARLFVKAGMDVQVVMSSGAHEFITPLTFEALTGNRVRDALFDAEAEMSMSHIELARWPDIIVIAPASAHSLAKIALGLADDLLSTLCLATDKPIAAAPAMNRLMWTNPATQTNVNILESRGVHILGPGEGEQACGETGLGRMLEAEQIFKAVNTLC